MLISSTVVAALTLYDGVFTFYEGILCLSVLLVYLAYTFSVKRNDVGPESKRLRLHNLLLLFFSVVGLYIGSDYTVRSVQKLSVLLGFQNTSVLALSAVAIGTSLPELIVSVQAARKRKFDMAIGNVIGSNIFNIGLVLGLSSFITSIIVPQKVIVSIFFLLGATAIYSFSALHKELTSFEGAVYAVIYILFLIQIFT